MRINVANIRDRGQEVHISPNAEWCLELIGRLVGGEAQSCSGDLTFFRHRKEVTVKGNLLTCFQCLCERCGDDLTLNLTVPISFKYVPSGQIEVERELTETELDVGWYDDGAIELSDVISEGLALGIPDRVICLNVEGCDIRTAALLASAHTEVSTGHPGFASLKNL